jgi:hypothetical protein
LWTADSASLSWEKLGTVATFHPDVPNVPTTPAERPDYGYPWMVKTGPDTWFCVFYCGTNVGTNSLWGLEICLGLRR